MNKHFISTVSTYYDHPIYLHATEENAVFLYRKLQEASPYICDTNIVYDILQYIPFDKIGKLFKRAAKKGDLHIAKYLNKFVEDEIDKGWALVKSAESGHLEVVKYLVDSGMPTCYITSAFLEASYKEQLNTVKYLVGKGADIHEEDDKALRFAATHGHLDMVKCLVEQKANIHATDDIALRSATHKGQVDVIAFLVNSDANVNARQGEALRNAVRQCPFETVELLVQKGAHIYYHEYDALFWIEAHRDSYEENSKTADYLLESIENIHENDDKVLRYAAEFGYMRILEYAADGASIGALNNALFLATLNKEKEAIEFLLGQGAKYPEPSPPPSPKVPPAKEKRSKYRKKRR